MIENIKSPQVQPDTKKISGLAQKQGFCSVFDVHSNGVVDKGDFSKSDLKNSEIKGFLAIYFNKDWTQTLEGLIKPVLDALNEKSFNSKKDGYEITCDTESIVFKHKKKVVKIPIQKDGTVTKDDIANLYNIIKNLSPDVRKDLLAEIDAIKLAEKISFDSIGFFGDNTISLSTQVDNYGINKNTIIHELGHAVSSCQKGKHETYSYNKALYANFGGVKGLEAFFNKLQDKYGKYGNAIDGEFGDGYALRNANEFFAEYYLYKKEGTTHHGSEKLFKVLEASNEQDIKTLLEIFESSLKFSKKEQISRKTID